MEKEYYKIICNYYLVYNNRIVYTDIFRYLIQVRLKNALEKIGYYKNEVVIRTASRKQILLERVKHALFQKIKHSFYLPTSLPLRLFASCAVVRCLRPVVKNRERFLD